jgi:hypothetical protein
MDDISKNNEVRNFGEAAKEPHSLEMKKLSEVGTWSKTWELGLMM